MPVQLGFDSPIANAALVLFLSFIGWVLYDYALMLKKRQSLPPGPMPWPQIGNHFSFPKIKPWFYFESLSKTYNSPILTMWLGRTPYIIINDAWVASDLMDKRANIYSSRPHMAGMGDAILATDTNQTSMVYGERWRLHRKLMHNVVGQQSLAKVTTVQCNEAKILTRDLLERPADFVNAIERFSCSIVSILGWGRRIESNNDPLCVKAFEFMEGANLVMPGEWIETIPQLLKLPKWVYPFPHLLSEGAASVQKYFIRLAREGASIETPSFAKTLLAEQKRHGLSDVEVAQLTSLLVGGGVDTTSSSLTSFILAMCTHPEVQAKAQAELDEVVGQMRCPEFEDGPRLPYVTACVRETLRWRTVATLGGIPHSPIQDDVYEGYLIPKGSWIMGNTFAIHRNPREFPDPLEFKPERYLEGNQKPFPNGTGTTAFGWGRRACSGQSLALQGLNISIAQLLWSFKMEPGLDEQGNVLELDTDPWTAYTDSENNRPKPYKARFTPRSDQVKQTLLQEAQIARDDQRIYDYESKTR